MYMHARASRFCEMPKFSLPALRNDFQAGLDIYPAILSLLAARRLCCLVLMAIRELAKCSGYSTLRAWRKMVIF